MRFSRGQNPPRGNEPEPQETPDPTVPDSKRRGDERTSWFAPLPPEGQPFEGSYDAGNPNNRGASSDRSRLPPADESFDPDDLYPPEYQPGGREATYSDAPPRRGVRAPSARSPYSQSEQGRESVGPRNDDRGSSNRDPYEQRPARERTTGNLWPNARTGGRDPSAPPISEQFGWQTPEGERNRTAPTPPAPPPLSAYWEEREERIRQEESGAFPRISPPGAGAYNPYSSGALPATPAADDLAAFPGAEGAYSPYSQQFILPPLEALESTYSSPTYSPTKSGALPIPEVGQSEHESAHRADAFVPGEEMRSASVSRSGAPAVPFSVTRSGRLATTGRPGMSGALPLVPSAPPLVAPARGSRMADAPARGLVTDPVVWSFLGLALVLTAAMVAFVALRYDSFPQRITLHFGPAGVSQRDRIGERQELWTIPFLSVIVLVANTALAFVFDFFDRHDRFVPRLLAVGSALVSTVAWVVLLTLLYR